MTKPCDSREWSTAITQQIKVLLEAYVKGDDERFLSVGMQVAAREATSGTRHRSIERPAWHCLRIARLTIERSDNCYDEAL